MATFGPVTSPFANVLYNPMAVDQAVQGRQRNQLMMDNARQDQAQQTFQRDATARIGMARELSALPEQEAAAQWGSYRQRLQASGLGQGLPEQFPGLERLKAVASSDMTTFQRMQLEERRRGSEALMGLLGGGAPAMGGAAPAAAPAPPGGAMAATPVSAPGGNMYGRNAPAAVAREALLDAPPAVLAAASSANAAQSGLPTNVPYRGATAGGEGGDWDAGIAPSTGAVPALAPTSAPMARPAAAPAPAGPALLPNGLTQQQAAQLAVIAQSNPQAALTQMGAYQQQNRMAQERAQDDARQQRQRAEDLEFRRASEARAEAARAEAAATARRAEDRAGIAPGWERDPEAQGRLRPTPGGPADPEVIRRTAQARGEGRPISGTERDKLLKEGGTRDSIISLRDGFQNDFGGFRSSMIGDVVNTVARNTPGASARAEWWQQYDRQRNIVRNELFGASLTSGEQAAFEKTDINPGMSPETIRANLKTQAEIVNTALQRRARSMRADGFSAAAITEATGLAAEEIEPGQGTGRSAPPPPSGGDRPPLSSFGR